MLIVLRTKYGNVEQRIKSKHLRNKLLQFSKRPRLFLVVEVPTSLGVLAQAARSRTTLHCRKIWENPSRTGNALTRPAKFCSTLPKVRSAHPVYNDGGYINGRPNPRPISHFADWIKSVLVAADSEHHILLLFWLGTKMPKTAISV